MRGRLRPAVGALILSVTLAACGGLATDGPLQRGLPVGEPAAQPARVLPDGPSKGATPEQIVRGFLTAGAGFDDKDHAIARSFFTPGSKQLWQPGSGVRVFENQSALAFDSVGPGTVRVTADLVASIDGEGHYREEPVGTKTQAIFAMARSGGQWRIAASPTGFGLWLSAIDLERLYSPFDISYVSPISPLVIADRRWFAVTPGLATTLARAQLGPIPPYLLGAVTTGVPEGTRLVLDAVRVVSGRAQVDLSGTALSATAELRRALWAQFVHTLLQVPAVQEVSIQVEGRRLDLPGHSEALSSLVDLDYEVETPPAAVTAIVRSGGVLERQDPTVGERDAKRKQPLASGPSPSALPRIPQGWVSLAIDRHSEEIAAIGGDGLEMARWRGETMHRAPKFGTHLTGPSYDGRRGLWVAGQSGGAAKVWVVETAADKRGDALPRAVDAPWLAGRKVLSFRVAGDNQRAAIITSDLRGGDIQVGVTGIIRSADSSARALTTPLRVGATLTSASDVSWLDESTLAVIGRVSPRDAVRPNTLEVGGRLAPLPPVSAATSVTTTGGPRGVIVITDRGTILSRAGNGWQQLAHGTDLLIPGG